MDSGAGLGRAVARRRRVIVIDRHFGVGFSRQERPVVSHHGPAAAQALIQLGTDFVQFRIARQILANHARASDVGGKMQRS